MLPWNYGFHWNLGHIIFLGAFYIVLMTVVATLFEMCIRDRACSVENNVPPAHEGATDRKGLTWIRVYKVDNGEEYPDQMCIRDR